jgi:hypothetical protein
MAAAGQEALQMSDPFVIFDFDEEPAIGSLIQVRRSEMPTVRL